MIWESWHWKLDLIKNADILARWAQKKWTTKRYVLFEKKVHISAFCIRKLLQAEQLGSDFPMWNIDVEFFLKKTDKQIHFMNNHKVDEFYDFEKPIQKTINIKYLTDQLIHEYIFLLDENEEGKVNGILFTSDKEKDKCIYRIDLEKFIDILKTIGHSSIVHLITLRDPKGWKWLRKYSFDESISSNRTPKSPHLYKDFLEDWFKSETKEVLKDNLHDST